MGGKRAIPVMPFYASWLNMSIMVSMRSVVFMNTPVMIAPKEWIPYRFPKRRVGRGKISPKYKIIDSIFS
jgi:hypothetical protein